MEKRKIDYGIELKKKMLDGVKKLNKAVSVTLGPSGRNVIIGKQDESPFVTKDGISVCQEVEVSDKIENLAIQTIKQSSIRTSEKVGDGTTTSVVIASKIYEEGIKKIVAGVDLPEMNKGIIDASKVVIERLRAMTTPVNEKNIKNIAMIAANNDEFIGNLIYEALMKIGKDGVITVENSDSTETYLKTVEGLQFDNGYLSPYFATNEEMTVEYEDCYIFISSLKINSSNEIVPLVEKVMHEGEGKPLLIICDHIEADPLALLILNKMKNFLRVVVVKAPSFGEQRETILEDIAILTGGVAYTEKKGYLTKKCPLSHLGRAKKVLVSSNSTTIVGGMGDKNEIRKRVDDLKNQLLNAASESEKQKLHERISKIAGGVSILKIGAATESELKEKKDRVDDALRATKAALEEGIVPGGGVALLRASVDLEEMLKRNNSHDYNCGVSIVIEACQAPIKTIISNATNDDPSIIIEEIKNRTDLTFGYDGRRKELCDLFERGIIDPVKVTRIALENAVSAATALLTAECGITIIDEKTHQEEFAEEYE